MGGSPKVSYFPKQEREKTIYRKRLTFKPGKKLPTLIAIFLLFYLLISFFAHFQRLYVLQRDIKEIEIQLQELSAKNEELKKQLKQVQSDAYIEQVAREKLGLVKPGESRIVPVPEGDEKNN
ncbi:MAG: septum formation initiator family protein [Peptococcaceae bacterium]|nr:septum formation initiator family protein [Peptococcaceae bacterium]